ncbi:hypothetical protein M0Q28_01475 [Patescibacteria group bacterium]|jgi:hypothetical protein|nr:hypothetical protein [Patescibacteria group bacterium]
MTVRFWVGRRVFVNYWIDEITMSDVNRALLQAKGACALAGPLAGIGILGETLKRPSVEIAKKMYVEHAEMRQYHESIHLVPLMSSPFLISGIKSLVTLGFYSGTGGKLHYHDSVKEALSKAEEYGPLGMPINDVLSQLEREKIPVGMSKRA